MQDFWQETLPDRALNEHVATRCLDILVRGQAQPLQRSAETRETREVYLRLWAIMMLGYRKLESNVAMGTSYKYLQTSQLPHLGHREAVHRVSTDLQRFLARDPF